MAKCEICNQMKNYSDGSDALNFKLCWKLEKLNQDKTVETLENFDYIICSDCANNVKLDYTGDV